MAVNYPMTEAGKKKLEEELQYLKEVRQKEVNDEVKYLRGFCDFSEDVAFAGALDQQSLVKERIQMIEQMLQNAEIIQPTAGKPAVVMLGSTVTFKEIPAGTKETYTIVGTIDADPLQQKISAESPIGKSLLGLKEKDEAQVETPSGEMKIKILEVN
jgi:transcription elongation factor GreA